MGVGGGHEDPGRGQAEFFPDLTADLVAEGGPEVPHRDGHEDGTLLPLPERDGGGHERIVDGFADRVRRVSVQKSADGGRDVFPRRSRKKCFFRHSPFSFRLIGPGFQYSVRAMTLS